MDYYEGFCENVQCDEFVENWYDEYEPYEYFSD